MTTPTVFLIQSRQGHWATCFSNNSELPAPVHFAAQVIINVTQQTLEKDGGPDKGSADREFPHWDDVPKAKRLRGRVGLRMPAMTLALFGKEAAEKPPVKIAFAFLDIKSGFYVGFPPDRFEDVEIISTVDGVDSVEDFVS